MRESDRAASLQNFIEQLNELYQRAGPPKLSRLRQLSEQVVVGQGVTGLRVLAESTTSDILSGKRSRFPEWPWVASFVTACWMAATETAIDPGPLGSVEEWRVRFRKARAEADRQADPVSTAPPAPRTTGGAGESDADSSGVEPVPPETLPPAELTPALQRFLSSYGRTGGRLLRHAEAGDGESAFRLAVLLLCDDRPMEAAEWLRRANRAGYDDALELLQHPQQRTAAARQAFRIGCEYELTGNLPAALVFFEQAADCEDADAAYRIGLTHAQQGRTWVAAQWFARAAAYGHPHAMTEFNGLSRQLLSAGWSDEMSDRPDASA
jgi:hypothetical protein